MARYKEIAASEYHPPAEMVRIANERTRDITRLWLQRAVWGPTDFVTLTASAYMQGINDAIDALQQQGLEVRPIQQQDAADIWEGFCG